MDETPRSIALRAIDSLWSGPAQSFLEMSSDTMTVDWAALIPIFSEIESTAREAREALEVAADHGEPEPLRQTRLILRMLEAASGVISYAWIGAITAMKRTFSRGRSSAARPWECCLGSGRSLPRLRTSW